MSNCNRSSECGGHYIKQFVSTGPKSYSYACDNDFQMCKVKGFTLNYTNSSLINLNVMKDLIIDTYKHVDICNKGKICRDKYQAKIYNRDEMKTFRMVYTKRVIQTDGFSTLPYGY
jgi:hypothetical protein